MLKSSTLILTLSFLIALLACGGKPDTSSDNSTPPTPPTPDNDIEWNFKDVTAASGLEHIWGMVGVTDETGYSPSEYFSGGIAAGDYNNDGLIDLFIDSGNLSTSHLFKNLGNNQFEDVTESAGLVLPNHKGSGASFADVDGDGWLDLFVGGINGDSNYLFINNKDETFTDQTSVSGLIMSAQNTISSAFGDFDRDGDLDLAVSHWGNDFATDTEHLWINDGQGVFTSASEETNIASQILVENNAHGGFGDKDYTFTPTFTDLNNDGWPDLTYVADFVTSKYFINDQEGRFIDKTNAVISDDNGMGSAIGDYDNDGDLDWLVTSIYETDTGQIVVKGNRLYNNNGDETFIDTTLATKTDNGGWGWGACFADFNNDGYLDILHTNGWRIKGLFDPENNNYIEDQSRLFISQSGESFINMSTEKNVTDNGQGRAVICFDSDNDGDIDAIVIGNNTASNSFIFYENFQGNLAGNYLNVKLVGNNNNTQAVNAKIFITVGTQTQMRELRIGGSFSSQNPVQAHFGLLDSDQVEQLKIVWPDGSEQLETNLSANQFLVFTQQ